MTNWAAYDIALRQRGSLTVWFTEAAIAAWKAEPRATRGGQPRYSVLAITTALTLRAAPCCMDQPVDAVIPVLVVSYDANVARASQRQHVEDVDSKCHLGCLTLVGLRAQRMADDPFPAANIGFHQGTPVVPRRFLPTHAAMFGNRLQIPVTRSGRILGRLARHATRTRWHNDRASGWRAATSP